MKKVLSLVLAFLGVLTLSSCKKEKKIIDGSYTFIVYASDADNNDISNNPVVATYTIEYYQCDSVANSLIQKDGKHYLSNTDYLVLANGQYGLYLDKGFFNGYNQNEVDLSWSKTTINGGQDLFTGIGETPLEGITSFELIIDGWK